MRNEKKNLWIQRLEEHKKSGLSKKKWCEEHNIPISTFEYWYYKIANSKDFILV